MPDGGWGVTSQTFPGEIRTFSATGAPRGTLGSEGQGPGEFRGQLFGVLTDQGLLVVDPGNARLTSFGLDLALKGQRPLPGRVFWATPTADRTGVLLSGFLGSAPPSTVGRLTMDQEADHFGGEMDDRPNFRLQAHMAAEPRNGEVWAIALSGGDVDILRSSDLSLVESRRIPGDDFAVDVPQNPNYDPNEPPIANVMGVTSGADGTVWIVAAVADSRWEPGASPRENPEQFFDTLVLAVDPPTRQIVAAKRLDEICLAVSGGRVSCVDEMGERIRISVLRRQ